MTGVFRPRLARAALLLTAIACAIGVCLSALLFSAARDDLAFRGRDALGAPDAIFTMTFTAVTALALAAIAVAALWKRARL